MGRRVYHYAGRDWPDPRNTRQWRRLVADTVREEPICWLRLPGICTTESTTADHIITVSERPDLGLVRSNVRGACQPCNRARGNLPAAALASPSKPAALDFFDT